ncbi:MAG: hypothetical protein GY944_04605, partial [bacterium]|nr:hypothetical protein [bacterium]
MGRNEAIEKAAREFCDACEACPETMAPVRVTTRMLAAHEQIIEALALPPDPAPDVRNALGDALAYGAACRDQIALVEKYHAETGGHAQGELEMADVYAKRAYEGAERVKAALSAHGDALTIDDLHREPYATFAHGDACICDDSLCGDPSHDDGGEARRKFYEAARKFADVAWDVEKHVENDAHAKVLEE